MSRLNFWSLKTNSASTEAGWVGAVYDELLPYVTGFLVAQHPHRKGVVCPFVPRAIKEDAIFFVSCPVEDTNSAHEVRIREAVEYYLAYKSGHPDSFGAIIILFPKDYSPEKLVRLQVTNKTQCVKRALMLGAFFKENPAPSLHSREWFPLRTPNPILVIRDLVPSDLVFLDPGNFSIFKKITFLRSFIRRFRVEKSENVKGQVRKAHGIYCRYLTGIAAAILGLIGLAIYAFMF